MDIKNLIFQLNKINPNDDSLYEVDSIIEDLYKLEKTESKKAIKPLFEIFERLNEGHYDSVLWSIIHGIEGFKVYEEELIESVNRKPNEYNILMVNRILNSGQKHYETTNYISLLKQTLNQNISQYLKEEIKGYLNKHSQ